MDKDRQMILRIKDAIGACRVDPSQGVEMTIRFDEEHGGGEFKISVEKLPSRDSETNA